jgi:anti-sigma factor RsiW
VTTPDEMNCRTLVELITEYLEDAVPEDLRASIDAHLAECEGCTNHLEQIRTTIRAAGHLSEEQIPPAARESLRRAFREWRATAP